MVVMDDSDLTICVCTYNSAGTLEGCLSSVRRSAPEGRLLVVDHGSTDSTREIAKRYGALLIIEHRGLGYARQLCFDSTNTEYVAFVDSDVEIRDNRFFKTGAKILTDQKRGAIVGMAEGHRFAYGLPAGLLLLRKRDFNGRVIPEYIDARETYFIEKRLSQLGLRVVYLADVMIHRSQFRKFKPEWEGANTRLACGLSLRQLLFAFRVVVLIALNSRSIKNLAYTPIFYLKFLRGFVEPSRWRRLQRKGEDA